MPKRNRQFWRDKFKANRQRDAAKIRALRGKGFRVIIVWECETADIIGLRQSLLELRKTRIVQPT